jgi:Protein of unknown function (DUF3311)
MSVSGPTIPHDEVVEPGEGPVSKPSSGVKGSEGLRVNPWNLLLLVPLLTLVTPWFNSIEPRLFGMPFFYWAQFAFVPVGVVCVAVVYLRTRDEVDPVAVGTPLDVDELDEGTAGRAER